MTMLYMHIFALVAKLIKLLSFKMYQFNTDKKYAHSCI